MPASQAFAARLISAGLKNSAKIARYQPFHRSNALVRIFKKQRIAAFEISGKFNCFSCVYGFAINRSIHNCSLNGQTGREADLRSRQRYQIT